MVLRPKEAPCPKTIAANVAVEKGTKTVISPNFLLLRRNVESITRDIFSSSDSSKKVFQHPHVIALKISSNQARSNDVVTQGANSGFATGSHQPE
jgi:hypothetical protein